MSALGAVPMMQEHPVLRTGCHAWGAPCDAWRHVEIEQLCLVPGQVRALSCPGNTIAALVNH